MLRVLTQSPAARGRGRGGASPGVVVKAVRGAGVQKSGRGRGAGRGGVTRVAAVTRPRQPYANNRSDGPGGFGGGRGAGRGRFDAGKRAAMSGHGEWSHDMYEGPTYGRRAVVAAVPQAAPMATRRRAGPTKVRIMNLGHDILEPELEQLFKKFNATKWSVRYDKSGRSTGIAYVEFSTFSDANRAKDEYHMRTIDDRPISLEIVDDVGGGRGAGSGSDSGIMSRLGGKVGGRGRGYGGMDID